MANKSGGGAPIRLKLRLSARSGESGSGQVARQLRELIAAGRLKAGDVLPSEDGLAEQLDVGRKIVRHAYGKLVEEGLLVSDFPRNKRVADPKSRARKKPSAAKASAKKSGGSKKSARR
ncbi:MAG TPA: winged helix-turn-helix domain-containing protein [Pyrinomonadaceae bacterium]|jgi:GntR family transcriptional regulator/MocR family aminotransferase|nr:winged helix-turn-helix domain-containing protein [Pyrinomonadaceae bacterium]